jgi:hypothetical protein
LGLVIAPVLVPALQCADALFRGTEMLPEGGDLPGRGSVSLLPPVRGRACGLQR